MTLEFRKNTLIEKLKKINDEKVIEKIEALTIEVEDKNLFDGIESYLKPIKESLADDFENIAKDFKSINKDDLAKICSSGQFDDLTDLQISKL